VHWIDKISEEFFVFLSHSIKNKKVLMLSAYRPEGTPGWAKGPYYRHLGVEPLSEKSSGHLVRNILSGVELDPNLEKLIMAKTGGNPFFVEEMVRELVERDELIKDGECYKLRHPIDKLDIPGTVQGIIAARMDRLSDDLKKTMQVASVIGRDFAYKILRSILELGDELRVSLTNLVGLEVLYEKALYPELEYIFKHALTQEVAYESLLKQRRREIHGRIAKAIEELYSDKLEQHNELLAHHWELSENPERAIKYLVLAGEKSNKAMAANTAVTFFSKAINLIQSSKVPQDPTLVLNIKIERARSFQFLGEVDNSIKDFEEALSLSDELGNQEATFEILSEIPSVIYNTSYKDKVPDYCGQAMRLAKSINVPGAEAPIIAIHSYWRYVWEDADEIEAIENALAMSKKAGQIKAIVQCSFFLSLFERWGGNPKKSLQYTEGLPELLQSVYNLTVACAVSFSRSWALIDTGRYNEAIVSLYTLLESVEQNNLSIMLGRIYNSIGWGLSETYSLDKAIDFNQKSLEHSIGLLKQPALIYSGSEQRAMAEVNIMENRYEMGDIDEAWNHILQFEEISGHTNYDIQRIRWSTRMKNLKGNILLKRGDLDSAELIANQCIEAAKKRGIKKYIGKAIRLKGKISIERGSYDQSENRLRTALTLLEEVGNPKQIWTTLADLANLYKRMNRPDLQRELSQRAVTVANNTAEKLKDNFIKENFISAPQIKQLINASKL